ncbi:MAG: leucine-rich repeat domain-containing protein [Bacteroidales bacterium]|nr:leucine-rich repeat domain-containing protein [Bacteroidales bacterium]
MKLQVTLLSLLFSFVFFSCHNDSDSNGSIDTVSVVIDNIIDSNNNYSSADTLSGHIVLDMLKTIDSDFLPLPAKKYLENPSSVKADFFDQFSVGFQFNDGYEYFQAKVQYLKPYCGMDIIGFFVFKSDDSGYTNYFYFLQYYNENWTNVSQLLLTDEVINLIINELNTNIDYRSINNTYAFVSGKTDKALLLDFSANSKIFVFTNENWISVAQIGFSENKINLIKKEQNSNGAKMLTSNELDRETRFTDFTDAILDSAAVYILDLTSIGMSRLDSTISHLKRLQVLILEDNYLTQIPGQVCKLKNLQILRINSNNLNELPEDIGLLENLEEISASNNNLTYLPLSLSKATKLKILNFDHNLLTSIIIDFSGMKNLAVLNLSDNKLKGLPTSIGKLENLISLDISNNPIESLPNQIYNLKNLHYIDLTKTNIPDSQIIRLMNINPDITIVMD